MFRSSLRSVRVLSKQALAPAAQRQWPIAASRQASVLGQRSYADKKNLEDASKPVVLPANETLSSERAPLVPDQHIPVPVVGADVPLTPPKPEVVARDVAGKDRPEPPASIDDVGESKVKAANIPNPPPPPPPPAPKKKGFFRRLRNFVFTLLVLGAIGFSGGVWYSRINDRFHDFFTEYIPFGEEAVLYLEELEFKQRFPNAPKGSVKPREGAQIRVPAQSGASWRVADSEPSTRLSSAGPTSGATPATDATVKPDPPKVAPTEPVPAPKPKEEALSKAEPAPAPVKKTSKTPEVNEPSKAPPLQPIDLMSLADAREPVVQDLVHMLNDLILVINADGAHGKYGTTINKAKDDIKKVGGKLNALKDKIEKKSADEVKSKMQEFDAAATELVSRVEKAMANQEAQWRQEFEDEMKKVRESYDERVKLVLDREQNLSEQKLQNQLLEQAIALKKEFTAEVKSHVEAERDSRLGKLDELAAAVKELEDLSLGWNSVVDSNLKTQQLHVAVESVRAKLESATHPQPFIKELVALKEIAADDSVVSSAIASINPSAYQRGIFTSSQLIDRFRKVAGEVRKASLLPDDAGVASHASSWVLSHVMFKKQGLPEGNDVESVLTRTQIFLEEGDLDAAAREMNGLEGWAKTLSKDWLLEVRKVLEVQQALDVIATEARLQSLRVD